MTNASSAVAAPVYVFLTTGFEEIEALATVDVLRRAGLAVQTVSLTGQRQVTGLTQIGRASCRERV